MERVHCGGAGQREGGGRNLSSLKPGIRLILHFVNSLSLLRSFGSALREGPGWFTGQALVFTFCPRFVEPIDGDTGFSADISWMHNLGAESED